MEGKHLGLAPGASRVIVPVPTAIETRIPARIPAFVRSPVAAVSAGLARPVRPLPPMVCRPLPPAPAAQFASLAGIQAALDGLPRATRARRSSQTGSVGGACSVGRDRVPALRRPVRRLHPALRCPDCQHEYLLAFTCKRRGLCATCHQWRMLIGAAFIADEVSAAVLHRHLVLNVPGFLRGRSRASPRCRANSPWRPAAPISSSSFVNYLASQYRSQSIDA
jgi:hypothetical protein